MLTPAERKALELTKDLYNLLAGEIVAAGPWRDADLGEAALRIHGIQHMIMAQSAARAHPDEYRLLGG